jgi:hypothetical protein
MDGIITMSKSILTRAGRLARRKGWTLEAAELYLLAEKHGWLIYEEYAGRIIIYTADSEFMEAYEQAFTEIKNNE